MPGSDSINILVDAGWTEYDAIDDGEFLDVFTSVQVNGEPVELCVCGKVLPHHDQFLGFVDLMTVEDGAVSRLRLVSEVVSGSSLFCKLWACRYAHFYAQAITGLTFGPEMLDVAAASRALDDEIRANMVQ